MLAKIKAAVRNHFKQRLNSAAGTGPSNPPNEKKFSQTVRNGSIPVFKVLDLDRREKQADPDEKEPQWVRELHFIQLRKKRSSMMRHEAAVRGQADVSLQTLFAEVERLRRVMLELS